MEIALIISLIALAVALPGCIADSLTVIEKLRRAKRLPKQSSLINMSRISSTFRDFLKKVTSSGPTAEPLGLRAILKKSEPAHAQSVSFNPLGMPMAAVKKNAI